MAKYHLNYRHYSHTVEAATKAAALKQWYEGLVPVLGPEGVTFKVFAKTATAVRQKVVKMETWSCPLDGLKLGRKEFINHVRIEHGQQ